MDINEARKEIDRIDRQMTGLFRERLLLCDAIAKYKEEHGLPLTDPVREREKLEEISGFIGEDLKHYAEELYAAIFEISKVKRIIPEGPRRFRRGSFEDRFRKWAGSA